MTRAAAVALLLLLLGSLRPAAAQTSDKAPEMVLTFRGYTVAAKGAELAAGVSIFDMAIPGRTATRAISTRGCGAFAASSNAEALEEADMGWRLEYTVVRVVDDAVTFRLRWARVIDRLMPGAGSPPGDDSELTLRLGESRPVDSVPVAKDAKTIDGKPCDKTQASIKVAVEPYPPELERRLIAIDVWLMDRLPDNNVQTRMVSLRSLPNRSNSFYFDSIRSADRSLDIFGQIRAKIDGETVVLQIETTSRWDGDKAFGFRRLDQTIRLRPSEVVEMLLPKLGNEAGQWANRSFSIRVKASRIR